MSAPTLPDIPQGITQGMYDFCLAVAEALKHIDSTATAAGIAAAVTDLVYAGIYQPTPRDYSGEIGAIERLAHAQPSIKSYDRDISNLQKAPFMQPTSRDFQKEIDCLERLIISEALIPVKFDKDTVFDVASIITHNGDVVCHSGEVVIWN